MDPGIDHMLAMQCFDEVHRAGGKVGHFCSFSSLFHTHDVLPAAMNKDFLESVNRGLNVQTDICVWLIHWYSFSTSFHLMSITSLPFPVQLYI